MTKLFEELTADEITKRVKERLEEFQQQPCYRCDHSLANPDKKCFCCLADHTPDGDGFFQMKGAA